MFTNVWRGVLFILGEGNLCELFQRAKEEVKQRTGIGKIQEGKRYTGILFFCWVHDLVMVYFMIVLM